MILGIEVEEQLVDLINDFGSAGIRSVDLVHHNNRGKMTLECLRQHIPSLWHRSLCCIDEEEHAINKCERSLDLATEICVTGCVDEVDLRSPPLDRRRLRKDRDPAFAFLVVRIHDTLNNLLVVCEHASGAKQTVNERRLAVVDVRDERDIA